MNISHYGFVCQVSFQMKIYKRPIKEIMRKKKKKKYFSGICEQYANTSHLTNIIPITISKF